MIKFAKSWILREGSGIEQCEKRTKVEGILNEFN